MDIEPSHYLIHLEPDLDKFEFNGKVDLTCHIHKPTKEIVLNARELEVEECLINGKNVTFEVSQEAQQLTLRSEKELKGKTTITVIYRGIINDKLAGFYRSKFVVDGKEEYAAVTQFQESDARRAFPCFDHPAKKATFDIELVVDSKYYCISNNEVSEEVQLDNGKKLVKFATTPKMSTYLVFIGVGNFEFIEAISRDRPVRVIASPGKAKAHGKFALDFGVKSLEYCEDWFGIEYPFPKMDMIATPDFAHGAMENWGAILFRENLLLHYPGTTSKNGELRIEEVIAHEVVHQWFGNLVSPSSWKYLWLNESFATFFSFMVVDHYYPEKRVWEFFISSETAPALNSDARHATMPIEVKGDTKVGMTIKNVNILYNKGGSVLRQVMAYLGEENFQKGLRHYLEKFKYSVATSGDLWNSLQEASGKPINELMESWVLQEGYPVVSVTKEGKSLKVHQRRFTFLPSDSDQVWLVPISIQLFRGDETEIHFFLLNQTEEVWEFEEDFDNFKLNIDSTGFFRVKYSKDHMKNLATLVESKRISPIDRWSIENDLYSFLVAGELSLDEYLDFIQHYRNEDNALPMKNIADHLAELHDRFQGDSLQEAIKTKGRQILDAMINTIGFHPKDDEDLGISMGRPAIVWAGVTLGSENLTKQSMELFEQYKAGQSISADLLATVLRIGAKQTNDFDWFMDKFDNAANEQELLNFGLALMSFSDPNLVDKLKDLIFEKIPYGNRGGAIAVFASKPIAIEGLWHWYLANLDNFEKLHPFMYQIALVSIISRSEMHEKDMEGFFKDYITKNLMVADAVEVGMELLRINKQIKKSA